MHDRSFGAVTAKSTHRNRPRGLAKLERYFLKCDRSGRALILRFAVETARVRDERARQASETGA